MFLLVNTIFPPTVFLSRRETLAKVMPASKQTDIQQALAAFNKRKAKALSATEDANIDFDSYKEILGAEEVDAIRKEYENYQYSDFEAEKAAELSKMQADLATTIAAIEEQTASLGATAESAAAELEELKRTRTTLETSIHDVIENHPDLYAELQERLANEDWDTETKPLDVEAMRLASIEKTWDTAALGPLDEATQKNVMDEFAALEAQAAAPSSDSASMPEYLSTYIAEWHEILGREVDTDAMEAFAAANTVTDADRAALTNERDIWREIDRATELAMFDRADGLVAHAEALRDSGDLVVDEAWRAKELKRLTVAQRHQTFMTPLDEAELVSEGGREYVRG